MIRSVLALAVIVLSLGGWAAIAVEDDARFAVGATQLVMMEEAGCSWCERWNEDIGVSYHLTTEGKQAPLRRVDVHDQVPADLAFLKSAYFTPTFVLVSGAKEIGRIQGYPGEDFFWPMLGDLLAKLSQDEAIRADAAQ